MKIFFAPGCPYAQRARAMLTLLDQKFEPHEIDLAHKPAEFTALSPTGKVPLLEDEGFVLYESQVINEYLAERFGWKDAFSPELHQRARERLAMKQFDETVVPLFFKALKDPSVADSTPNWQREVQALGETAKKSKPASLLGLHMATHWQRMTWVAPQSAVVKALRESLGEFLDAAAALPAVVSTAPDRESTVKMMLERFGPRPAAA